MLQEKKSAQAKTARRDIATLLEQSKVEKAKVKVENSASASYYLRPLLPRFFLKTICVLILDVHWL